MENTLYKNKKLQKIKKALGLSQKMEKMKKMLYLI